MSDKDKPRGLLIYDNWIDTFDECSVEQAGLIIKAICRHYKGEPFDNNDPTVRLTISDMCRGIDQARKAYEDICKKNRDNARRRWEAREKEEAQKTAKKSTRPAVPKPKTEQEEPKGFLEFWEAYPKKSAKADARKAWLKIRPDEELLRTMLSAIEKAKTGRQWREGYIPNPATWLNAERWNDEPDTSVRPQAVKQNAFNGFEQRAYNYDDLERRLTGN